MQLFYTDVIPATATNVLVQLLHTFMHIHTSMKMRYFIAQTKPEEYTNDQSLTGNNSDNIHPFLSLLWIFHWAT